MTSLTEVYDGDGSLHRLTLGVVLFGAGATATLAGVVLATTTFGADLLGMYGAREVAGVLAGLGVPTALVGVLTALPARPRVRAASVAGGAVAAGGVGMFSIAYPAEWVVDGGLAAPTLVVYFLGVVVAFWALFVGVATFQRRRSPGGTVRLEVRDGETRIVRVPKRLRSTLSGGVGLFGSTPDPGVETQTAPARSDGGTTTAPPDATTERDRARRDSGVDPYCGNCEQFRYVRTDDGLVPYCGLHEELMDDMEACEEWIANTGDGTELGSLGGDTGGRSEASASESPGASANAEFVE
jgi:hypothetical protein